MICDGFPYYVHFISEKLFWRVFEAQNGGKVTPELFIQAMEDAANAMDMKLRGPYEKATQKYDDTYSAILFAVADGHELKKLRARARAKRGCFYGLSASSEGLTERGIHTGAVQ